VYVYSESNILATYFLVINQNKNKDVDAPNVLTRKLSSVFDVHWPWPLNFWIKNRHTDYPWCGKHSDQFWFFYVFVAIAGQCRNYQPWQQL